jgi:hypothetical protein
VIPTKITTWADGLRNQHDAKAPRAAPEIGEQEIVEQEKKPKPSSLLLTCSPVLLSRPKAVRGPDDLRAANPRRLLFDSRWDYHKKTNTTARCRSATGIQVPALPCGASGVALISVHGCCSNNKYSCSTFSAEGRGALALCWFGWGCISRVGAARIWTAGLRA